MDSERKKQLDTLLKNNVTDDSDLSQSHYKKSVFSLGISAVCVGAGAALFYGGIAVIPFNPIIGAVMLFSGLGLSFAGGGVSALKGLFHGVVAFANTVSQWIFRNKSASGNTHSFSHSDTVANIDCPVASSQPITPGHNAKETVQNLSSGLINQKKVSPKEKKRKSRGEAPTV